MRQPLRWLGEKLVKAIHLHELNTRLLVQKVLPEPLYDRILDARRPRVAVLMRQTHEPAVLIEQSVVDTPAIHADADQFVLEERGSGGNALLDLIEERGQVPVYVLAPPNGHVRKAVHLSQGESLAVKRPGDGPSALRSQVEREVCLPSSAHVAGRMPRPGSGYGGLCESTTSCCSDSAKGRNRSAASSILGSSLREPVLGAV